MQVSTSAEKRYFLDRGNLPLHLSSVTALFTAPTAPMHSLSPLSDPLPAPALLLPLLASSTADFNLHSYRLLPTFHPHQSDPPPSYLPPLIPPPPPLLNPSYLSFSHSSTLPPPLTTFAPCKFHHIRHSYPPTPFLQTHQGPLSPPLTSFAP